MDIRAENVDLVPDFEVSPSPNRDCDRPIDRSLGFKDLEAIESAIGISPVPDDDVRRMRATIVANLVTICAGDAARWIFYSRDRSHYFLAANRRYAPPWLTYRSTLAAVDDLEVAGCIEHDRTPPSSIAQFRSRLRATADFAVKLCRIGAADLDRTPHEPIILRDDRKCVIDYTETRHVRRMRDDVRSHSAFLASRDIALPHANGQSDPKGWIIVDGRTINPTFRSACRVFNHDFCHGGRWFAPWWQALPRRYRHAITIDGAATVELDYRACHPRLLCAAAGLELPFHDAEFDFYRHCLPGEDRAAVKLATNIMINARSPTSAHLALFKELRDHGEIDPPGRARTLIDTIGERLPKLARFWSSGVGLRLQNIDAAICARVQRKLRRVAVASLSIHDSFIVETRHRSVLADAMEDEMRRACEKIERHSL